MPEPEGSLHVAAARAALTLPAEQLAELAARLEREESPGAGARARLRALVATDTFAEAVDDLAGAWAGVPAISGAGIALALRSAGSAVGTERAGERLEIVWTGPTTAAVALRRTRAVLFELLREAHSRVTLVSYAAFRQDDLLEELERTTSRGVRVRLVLESAAASRGRLDDDAARAFAALEGKAEVLAWPLELRGEAGAAGVLHAKAAIVDRASALVSSANLTGAALDRNMELGLLVRGGPIPRRLEEHFDELRAKGVLRPVGEDQLK